MYLYRFFLQNYSTDKKGREHEIKSMRKEVLRKADQTKAKKVISQYAQKQNQVCTGTVLCDYIIKAYALSSVAIFLKL